MIENTRQVIRELLQDTESRKIKWINTFESEDEYIFNYRKQITDKKDIRFTLKSKRDKYNSDLRITFGPVVESLKGGVTTIGRQEVGIISVKNQPLLYDLIDCLNRKLRIGDINYIKENKVNETLDIENGKFESERFQNIKLILMLIKNTQDSKLAWEDTHHDKHIATFIANFALTPFKKLVFSVRCCDESEIKEDNILRCLMSIENKQGKISHNTFPIRSLSLKEYPSLIALIKKLNKKYLSREFESPFFNSKKSFPLAGSTAGFKVGKDIDNNVEEYKKYGIGVIRTIMRELPSGKKDNWEENFTEIYDAYEAVKKCNTIEEIDNLIFKAHEYTQRKNPIGNPRWAR